MDDFREGPTTSGTSNGNNSGRRRIISKFWCGSQPKPKPGSSKSFARGRRARSAIPIIFFESSRDVGRDIVHFEAALVVHGHNGDLIQLGDGRHLRVRPGARARR